MNVDKTKTYHLSLGVGKSKYVVSYYDGIKKYNDGSDFSDIAIFKNKKKLTSYITSLEKLGYIER